MGIQTFHIVITNYNAKSDFYFYCLQKNEEEVNLKVILTWKKLYSNEFFCKIVLTFWTQGSPPKDNNDLKKKLMLTLESVVGGGVLIETR